MKINVNNINNDYLKNNKKYTPSCKGMWNNKALLKGLETISEHGATFVAATTFIMSTCVRPFAISLTPDTDQKNKEYASTNSIASGIIKFALVEAIALPVENAIKQIDKEPEKFLNSKTVKNLQSGAKSLTESRSYKFATQFLKQSTGLITAIPKASLTVALIPVLMNLFNGKKKQNNYKDTDSPIYHTYNSVFSSNFNQNNQPSFKGALTNQTAKGIGKILNLDSVQNAAKKYCSKDTNIARNMSIATDLLLTSSFVYKTYKSNKIEKERKKTLIANNVISTGITLLGGCTIDNLIKKGSGKFIKKFSEINKDNPKLNKYIEGINILRPTIIFALLYYGILPIFSTYTADKIDKFTKKPNNETKEK